MKPFHLEILTIDQVVFEGEAEAVSVPGVKGAMGILAGHEPLITALLPGVIRISKPGQSPATLRTISRGLMQVAQSKVLILLDTFEKLGAPVRA